MVLLRIIFTSAFIYCAVQARDNARDNLMSGDLANAFWVGAAVIAAIACAIVWAPYIGGKVAEPMMYVVGGKAVGCTYRVNEHRDAFGNLNAAGMTFKGACEADIETEDKARITEGCPVLALMGRLAALAAYSECYETQWDI